MDPGVRFVASSDKVNGYNDPVFLDSRKTARFSEQTMSVVKNFSIFSRQVEALVFIILQIFFAALAVLKIGNIKFKVALNATNRIF